MEIGVVLPNTGALTSREAIFAVAERAEAHGLDALWTADHLALPRNPSRPYPYFPGRLALDPGRPFLEPLVTLAAVAARTERIRLGVGVFILPFRHPLVAAKLVASLDQLAAGRLIFGVGLGWIPEEYAAAGVPWEERGARFDEQIRYLRALFGEDEPRFRGRFYRFEDLGFEPRPVRREVPIWIGGNSRPALRRAAALGDGWHGIDLAPADLERAAREIAAACRAAGRSPDAVALSLRCSLQITDAPVPAEQKLFPLAGPRDEIVETLRAYARLGLAHITLAPFDESSLDRYLAQLDLIAELAGDVPPDSRF